MDPKTAREEWGATQGSGTPRVIGQFYEKLTKKMTGAEDSAHTEGDLLLWIDSATAVGIEVKGANSNRSFRIREDQFENHLELASGFPYEGNFFYFLYSYTTFESRRKVPGNGNRRCMIRKRVLEGRGEEFLIKRTRHLWVLPVQLIKGLSLFSNERASLVEHDGIRIGRKMLGEFAKKIDGDTPSKDWKVHHGSANLLPPRRRTKRINFRVTLFRYQGMPRIPLHGVTWD